MDKDSGNLAVSAALTARGVIVVRTEDVGNSNLSDSQQIDYARQHGLVTYTANVRDSLAYTRK